jgi:NADH-quinone oxidoreductase subunit E
MITFRTVNGFSPGGHCPVSCSQTKTTPSNMSTQQILEKFEARRDNLLMILHALQDNHPQNYLTEEALGETARYLKLTKSSVYGVAKYYTMFSLKPRGKYIIRVCVSTVCELMKGMEVLAHLENILGVKTGETTPCGTFTLEISECLGQCQEAPSMMINDKVFNHLNEQKNQGSHY